MTSLETEATTQPATERLPWEKPALRSISLVAEEVLGTGCKASPAGPNLSGSATLGCIFIGCLNTPGS